MEERQLHRGRAVSQTDNHVIGRRSVCERLIITMAFVLGLSQLEVRDTSSATRDKDSREDDMIGKLVTPRAMTARITVPMIL